MAFQLRSAHLLCGCAASSSNGFLVFALPNICNSERVLVLALNGESLVAGRGRIVGWVLVTQGDAEQGGEQIAGFITARTQDLKDADEVEKVRLLPYPSCPKVMLKVAHRGELREALRYRSTSLSRCHNNTKDR